MTRINRFFLMAKPSAILPVAMSLTAFALVMGDIALFGVHRDADEGTAAHIWQLLMAGQLPVILFYALKWFSRAPKQVLFTIGVQLAAAVLALAPVYWLGL